MLTLENLPARTPGLSQESFPPIRNYASGVFMALLIGLLAACAKKVEKTEDIRPVRVVQAGAVNTASSFEIPGEVRARVESRLGFRVPGKIILRKVELGSQVKKGQLLMQLDPQDLSLAQAQAKAGLLAAQSNRDLAATEFKRYQDLRSKNYVAAAVLDAKEVAYKSAQASFEQAQAAYKNQSNQAGYTSLIADADGVITGIDAEVGQVVAAGTPVVRIAQGKDMDVVIGVPEDKVNQIKSMQQLQIKLWANSGERFDGKLRELSPLADPATRTYLAKIVFPDAKDGAADKLAAVRLGMTATVSFKSATANSAMRLPMTALFQDKNQTAVWVVQDNKVHMQKVQLAGSDGELALISAGIQPGQTIVTAGVNILKSDQKVAILNKDAVSEPQKAAANAASSAVSGSAK